MAMAGSPNKMLTLTINTNVGDSPMDRRRLLYDAWRVLAKRMKRKLKIPKLPYMAFIEKTKAGEPHLHILLRCKYIHYKWYQRQMQELVKSPIIWIEQIKNSKRAAFYVTKYCTKAPAQFGKLKRYWKSKSYEEHDEDDIPFPRARQVFDRVLRDRFSEIVDARLSIGWALKPISDGWIDFISPKAMNISNGYVYRSNNELSIVRKAE
jgi:hypothetical protein